MDTEKQIAGIELPDYSIEQEMKLEVGITYQGSFRLSKNGMIVVKPYQQGTKPSNLKKATEGDRHAIYLSKNLVRIVMSIHRGDLDYVKRSFRDVASEAYASICELNL